MTIPVDRRQKSGENPRRGQRAGGRWRGFLSTSEGRRKEKGRRKTEGRPKRKEREGGIRVQTDWGT